MKIGIGVLYKKTSGKRDVHENRISDSDSDTVLTREWIRARTFPCSLIVVCYIRRLSIEYI